ncbi:putative Na+/H+ antiporter [Undibacterium sp. TS12]|uniref:putative Na+/H+ antiporter n=1 Tax=Undibacterium sp. TS12 TaxID=2908202 RepID=UPI001F4C8259|nr:putative Na+/H+ antiporter [Undibacterium sp. TS12]MCH8619663.1 putative Na+/H+ antiporter [Undibacterium sp. TS12]
MNTEQTLLYIAAAIFAVAVLHTFSGKFFAHMAHQSKHHSGLWHLLGEVEVVFGFWAFVLVMIVAAYSDQKSAIHYLEGQNFTEPLFVFVILVISGTKPVLWSVQHFVSRVAAVVPLPTQLATYFLCLSLIPLLGSVITEPAAMTLAALMLRDRFYKKKISAKLKYMTLGTLFVNVSIGGVLTPFAAPPVLMVAEKWGWNVSHMFFHFGWKAAAAVALNALMLTLLFRKELQTVESEPDSADAGAVPLTVVGIHYLFLVAVVWFSHYSVVFLGLFLFFLGFTEAYKQYQDRLMLREGLLVAFFLAGLVVLGGMQQWWLQAVLAEMKPAALYWGATALTAITDNAALTYLGSLVAGLSDASKYALVAGAVTGGGLTVIANAPNPAAYAILKEYFHEQAISPLGLFAAAAVPTLIAAIFFQLA